MWPHLQDRTGTGPAYHRQALKAVIPVGRGRPATLPYVLRSLKHADVTEVVTVGETPQGIEPDLHIPSPNTGLPYQNVAGHLRRVCEKLGGEFMWCDDDTVLMKPWTPGVYVWHASIVGMLRLFPQRGRWSEAVRASIGVIREWGFDPDEVPAGTVHRPWLVSADRALMVLDALDRVGGGSFKALYPAGLDGLIVASNPKVTGRQVPHPDMDVISLATDSWRYNAGRVVRDAFGDPSDWETVEPVLVSTQRGPRRRRHR